MANRGHLSVYIPLKEVPDPQQRQELETLYKAENAWDDEYGPAYNEDYHEWMAEQGVKSEVDKDGKVRMAISAEFMVRDEEVWVSLDNYHCDNELVLRQPGDIFLTKAPMIRGFKWDIPWWAQLPFAGGEKHCNGSVKEEVGHLSWEAPLSLMLENLDYAIEIHQVFPIWGPAWQWSWIFESVDRFNDLGFWLSEIHHVCPRAFAILDWSEIAWNMMSPQQTISHNEPNRLMSQVKELEADKESLYEWKITMDELAEKYAMKTLNNDPNGFVADGERTVRAVAKEMAKQGHQPLRGGGKR